MGEAVERLAGAKTWSMYKTAREHFEGIRESFERMGGSPDKITALIVDSMTALQNQINVAKESVEIAPKDLSSLIRGVKDCSDMFRQYSGIEFAEKLARDSSEAERDALVEIYKAATNEEKKIIEAELADGKCETVKTIADRLGVRLELSQ